MLRTAMMRKIFIVSVLLLTLLPARSQSVTGCWYGKAEVNSSAGYNNYLIELYIRQKGQSVEGYFAYYFKSSYQSFRIKGTYSPQYREIRFKGLPLLHHSAPDGNGVECPMNFSGILSVARAGSSIKGSFYSEAPYKYTCPEMRAELQLDREASFSDSVYRHFTAQKIFWKKNDWNALVIPEEIPSVKDTPAQKPAPTPAPEIRRPASYAQFLSRKNEYANEIEVDSDSIQVSFYDNGNVDHDTITVYLNQQPIVVAQELTLRAINLYLALDPLRETNEICMYANNLGTYPPNTAVLVIMDGSNRYEVVLSSTLEKNAAVRLKRKKRLFK